MPTTPMREDQLQRPRKDRGKGRAYEVTKGAMMPTTMPAMEPDWHPIAKRLYRSLGTSGQSAYYQNSDWALAYSLCDDLSRYKAAEDRAHQELERREKWYAMEPEERELAGFDRKTPPPISKGGSAVKLQTIMSAMGDLMVTEADRRRVHIELHDPNEGSGEDEKVVAQMSDYRKRLAK